MTEFPPLNGASAPPASPAPAAKSLASIAHDLRSPLASIRTGLEVLKLSLHDPAQVEKLISMLERQTVELTEIIDEMVPKEPPKPSIPDGTPADSNESAPSAYSNQKVLVVDDSRSAVEILSLFFRMEGLEVETAQLGEEAVNLARDSEPCVVFLDLGLPDMSGYEVAEKVRQMPGGDKFFLVALTGRNEEEDRLKIKEAGFDLHVVKPPAPAILRDVLQLASVNR